MHIEQLYLKIKLFIYASKKSNTSPYSCGRGKSIDVILLPNNTCSINTQLIANALYLKDVTEQALERNP